MRVEAQRGTARHHIRLKTCKTFNSESLKESISQNAARDMNTADIKRRQRCRAWVGHVSALLCSRVCVCVRDSHPSPWRSACLARWLSRGWWAPTFPVCGLPFPDHCSSPASPGLARTRSASALSSCFAHRAAANLPQDKKKSTNDTLLVTEMTNVPLCAKVYDTE